MGAWTVAGAQERLPLISRIDTMRSLCDSMCSLDPAKLPVEGKRCRAALSMLVVLIVSREMPAATAPSGSPFERTPCLHSSRACNLRVADLSTAVQAHSKTSSRFRLTGGIGPNGPASEPSIGNAALQIYEDPRAKTLKRPVGALWCSCSRGRVTGAPRSRPDVRVPFETSCRTEDSRQSIHRAFIGKDGDVVFDSLSCQVEPVVELIGER